MTLTNQQQECLELFKKWVNDPKSKRPYFVITGAAGVGKSFLAKQLINYLENVIAIAPTHQAAGVLQEKIGSEVITTAVSIGLSPNLNIADFDPTNPKFKITKQGKLAKASYGLQDETSMLAQEVTDYQLDYCRMIYLGDHAQLPPVKAKQTNVLLEPDYELTEIIRTKKQDIIDLSNKLREPNWKRVIKSVKSSENIQVIKKEDFQYTGVERVLAYTNKTVGKWNSKLRHSFTPNEIDIYKFYENSPDWKNSEEFKISNIKECEKGWTCVIKDVSVIIWDRPHYQEYVDTYLHLSKVPYTYYNSFKKRQDDEYYEAWDKFFTWRAGNLIREDIYYKKLNKTIKKCFDLGYSMTLNKAQGSSLPTTVIDTTDIKGPDSQALLYVGVTRTMDKLILLK
jgi:AAA domain/UvrD-like helicase C-terminal domain